MPVRLGVLTRSPTSAATRRFRAAGRERGLLVEAVDYAHLELQCTVDGRVSIARADGSSPLRFDGVIGRISPVYTPLGASVLRAFRQTGSRVTPAPEALQLARDKFQATLALAAADLPVPATTLLSRHPHLERAVRHVGGYPFVVKPLSGTQGQGVELVRDATAARKLLARLAAAHQGAMARAFIGEAAGSDVRVVVCGGRVVAAIVREAQPGEFRSNLHLGGSARPVVLSEREASLAVRAARALGLGIAGVDLLRTARGPLVLEVNASPGLAGVEGATGIDVAGAMIDHVLADPAILSTS